jgi:hypothetical protein
MSEEHNNRAEEQRYAGLTTAALTDAGKKTASEKRFELLLSETEPERKVRAGSESSLGDNSVATAPIAAARVTVAQETLLSAEQAQEFRVRWDTIQVGFVDEPHFAVEQADDLVAGAMKRLAEILGTNGQSSKRSGIAARACRPRISGLRSAAIGRFSVDFFRFRRWSRAASAR